MYIPRKFFWVGGGGGGGQFALLESGFAPPPPHTHTVGSPNLLPCHFFLSKIHACCTLSCFNNYSLLAIVLLYSFVVFINVHPILILLSTVAVDLLILNTSKKLFQVFSEIKRIHKTVCFRPPGVPSRHRFLWVRGYMYVHVNAENVTLKVYFIKWGY